MKKSIADLLSTKGVNPFRIRQRFFYNVANLLSKCKKITANPFLKGNAIAKSLLPLNGSNKGKGKITFGLDFSPLEKNWLYI